MYIELNSRYKELLNKCALIEQRLEQTIGPREQASLKAALNILNRDCLVVYSQINNLNKGLVNFDTSIQ